MMARQGKMFTEDEVHRIVRLLSSTDMTIPEIAERMRCSRSAVVSINRKCQIRNYGGLRSTWTLQEEARQAIAG
jgi:hypothetical protein